MKEKQSNYECPACGAKLLIVRIPDKGGRADRATCPHCTYFLRPREGDFILQYRLLQRPPKHLD